MKLRNKYTDLFSLDRVPRLFLAVFISLSLSNLLHGGNDQWITEQVPDKVLGQPDFETRDSEAGAEDLNRPRDIAIDPMTGKVFVSDSSNHRVLRYENYADVESGASAEAVFGQDDFEQSSSGLDAGSMNLPHGVACGPNGELWVADYNNHRVLRFDNAATAESGADADGVLGQSDFVSNTNATTRAGLYGPRGLSCDYQGNLIIADLFNDRVIVHGQAHLKSDGADADFVLGQPDFETNGSGNDSATFSKPSGVFLTDDRALYVADSSNNRIVIFDDVSGLESGADASRVLGQSDFGISIPDISSTKFYYPADVWVTDTDKLFVCDRTNTRILVFENASTINGLVEAKAAIGAPSFTETGSGDVTTDILTTWGILVDPDNRLWVADYGNNRVLIFDEEYTQADLTIGDSVTRQKGENVYSTSGAGQKKRVRTSGRKVKLHCRIGNDGSFAESFICSGTRTTRKFKVKHFAYTPSKANVTAQVKAGTYVSNEISTSSYLSYRMDVKPKKSAGSRARINAYVKASAITDGDSDRVIGKVFYRE
ncbi:MAG: hypothetical protein CMO55_21435 [Verrucomicrobiales bacterium]|nr:hypothetical protein [Verrucomicrobiales bacterium]